MPDPRISNGGLTRTDSFACKSETGGDNQRPLHLTFGFGVESDAGQDRRLDLLVPLAGPGK
jgi:hypothetical protein